jgi:hypothetical protein
MAANRRVADMNNAFEHSGERNIDYIQPVTPLADGIANIKRASEELAKYRKGDAFTEKCFACITVAMSVAKLIRENDKVRTKLEAEATTVNVEVRSHANNRDILLLLKFAQHKIAGAATATERNRWATIMNYALERDMSAEDVILKVKAVGGINKASSEWAKLEPQKETPDESMVMISFTTEFDCKLVGMVPASLAERIAKTIRKVLVVGGIEVEDAAAVDEAITSAVNSNDAEVKRPFIRNSAEVSAEPHAVDPQKSWWRKNSAKVMPVKGHVHVAQLALGGLK